MVITDYFRQGKAPTEVCPLHPGHNMLATMAGWFGKDGAKPVPASELGAADAVGARRGGRTTRRHRRHASDGRAAGDAAPTKKKRGFWSRVFGKRQGQADAAARCASRPK